MNSQHIVIFSHGFGVEKDDRGLFTDIAAALPHVQSILFDYNNIDETTHTLTVLPFSGQIHILRSVYEQARISAPTAIIDVIAHSQGCIIAAMARLPMVRRAILLAPPTAGGEDILRRYQGNPRAHIDLEGMSMLKRSDGSTTLVPAQYFAERLNDKPPVVFYNEFSESTDLTLVVANQDHVLGNTQWDHLSPRAHLLHLDGDHDFSGVARTPMIETVTAIVNSGH